MHLIKIKFLKHISPSPQLLLNNNKFRFSLLKQTFKEVAQDFSKQLNDLRTKQGNQVIGKIKINDILGGMRNMKLLFHDTSYCDPINGVLLRGYTLQELQQYLPKSLDSEYAEPLPEGLLWLLMTGLLPTQKQFLAVKEELQQRSVISDDIKSFILSLPQSFSPITMLSMSVLFMQKDSLFAKNYSNISRDDHWDYYYEDGMNLIAKIPQIAALIYRHKFHNSSFIEANSSLDWAANYSHMLGYDTQAFYEFFRGYLCIHSDHDGGTPSTYTTHIVSSSLSDAYLSYASGIDALAGALHGSTSQNVLLWLLNFREFYGQEVKIEKIEEYIQMYLQMGKVVPGFGHTVKRQVDPRFLHQVEFAQRYLPDDPLIQFFHKITDTVPQILKKFNKIQNPSPNADSHKGVTLYCMGMKEHNYYTVPYAVSRCLGCISHIIWCRFLQLPILYPVSLDKIQLMELSSLQNSQK